jgi:hypothetical protein
MTAAHYKGGHPPGNDLGLHYTALPPIVASCPYSDQLLMTRKFWSPGANRPSQARSSRWSYQLRTRQCPIATQQFAALSPASGPTVGLEAIQLTATPLTRSQPRKTGIQFGMRAVVIGHFRSRQAALRGDKAVDPALRPLMPADVEGGQFREELQLAARQVVTDPPCKGAPIRTVAVAVGKPWHDDGGHGPHSACGIATVPNMAAVIAEVRSAAEPMLVAELVDRGARYAERIASRPKVASSGSSSSSHSLRPAALATSGASGMFGMPQKSAISLCRKSRMKNDADSRTRPSSSRLLTEPGRPLMRCASRSPALP